MSTLNQCLKKAKDLKPEYKEQIQSLAEEYQQDGLTRTEAGMRAIDDTIVQAVEDFNTLAGRIRDKGGVIEDMVMPEVTEAAPVEDEVVTADDLFDGTIKDLGSEYQIQVPESTRLTEEFIDKQARDLDLMTVEESKTGYEASVTTQHVDSRVEKRHWAKAASPELKERLKAHRTTPWAREVKRSLIYRMEIIDVAEGKIKAEDAKSLNKTLANMLEQHGWEGGWRYLEKNKILGKAGKPQFTVNSSLQNCDPSKACAKFCYATAGRHIWPASKAKAELVDLMTQRDPVRAANMAAEEFKSSEDGVGAAWKTTALRMFDIGDGTDAHQEMITQLNRKNIRTHVFSKKPEFLQKVDARNTRLLSIDDSNVDLAAGNDLPLAINLNGGREEKLMHDQPERVQVVLPVYGDKNFGASNEVIEDIPIIVKDKVCPVDSGQKKRWNCLKCDKGRGIGCFSGQITFNGHFTGAEGVKRDINDVIRRLDSQEKLSNAEAEQIDGLLQALQSRLDSKRESRAAETYEESQVDAEGTEGKVRETVESEFKYEVDPEKQTDADNRARQQAEGLVSLWSARSGTILANQIAADFKDRGTTKLTGQVVRNHQELADLAEIYRNPSVETFRVFYTKGDQIVGQTGLTSRMPGVVQIFNNKEHKEQVLADIRAQMKTLEADGFWMQHNHPSGNPDASSADIGITGVFQTELKGFKGHVIINGNTYGFIDENGTKSVISKRIPKDSYEVGKNPTKDHPLLGYTINSPDTLAAFAKELRDNHKGQMQLVSINRNGVAGILSIPAMDLYAEQNKMRKRRKLLAEARAFSRQTGAGEMFLVNVPTALESLAQAAVKNGVVIDALMADQWTSPFSLVMKGAEKKYTVREKSYTVEEESSNYSTEQTGFDDTFTTGDKLKTLFYNRFHALSKVQEAAKEANPDTVDVERTVTLYPGATRAVIEDFEQAYVEPLADAIKATGMSFEDVGKYLHARHAEEANEVLRFRNPTQQEKDERIAQTTEEISVVEADMAQLREAGATARSPQMANLEGEHARLTRLLADIEAMEVTDRPNKALSGMSNEEAAGILIRYGNNNKLRRVAEIVDEVSNRHVNQLVADELLTEEEAMAWRQNYRYYVPLNRKDVAGDMPGRGRGFDMRGKPSKIRGGSEKTVDYKNMIAHLVGNAQAGIVRGQKNKIAQDMYRFVVENPDDNMWSVVDKPEDIYLDKLGVAKRRENMLDDQLMAVKFNGVNQYIWFKSDNEHAERIATAMKNLNMDQGNRLINFLMMINRYLSAINTSLSPEFVISNFFRDVQTAGYNLTDTDVNNMELTTMARAPKALRAIRSVLRGDGTAEYADDFREFRKLGGMTGWLQSHEDIDSLMKSIESNLRRRTKPGAKQFFDMLKWIEDYNTIVENGIRLSTFISAKEHGLSAKEAARISKEITVDFNRKGEWGMVLNSAYLFYNASIQGTVRMLRAIFAKGNWKLRGMLLATVGFATALDMLNRALGQDDDDEESKYDKIPDHVKERNLIIMDPTGTFDDGYAKIPLPWGYNIFHVLGQEIGKATDAARGNIDGYSVAESAGRVFSASLQAFNPIQDGSFLQTLTPTIADPITKISENKDWHGGPLYPDYNKSQPDHTKFYQNVPEEYKTFTKWLAEITKNPGTQKSLIDWSPEWVDMIADTLTGAAGRVAVDSGRFIYNAATQGPEMEWRDIPIARKVIGEVGPSDRKRSFYDAFYEIEDVKAAVNRAKSEGDNTQVRKIFDDIKQRRKLFGTNKLTKSQLNKLKKQKKNAIKKDRDDLVRRIEEQELKIMDRYMETYREVMYQ